VQPLFEFRSEEIVNHSVSVDESLLGKALAHDDDLEMRLRSRRHAVHVTLVDHFDMQGRKCLVESAVDAFLSVHEQGFSEKSMVSAAQLAPGEQAARLTSDDWGALAAFSRPGATLCPGTAQGLVTAAKPPRDG
jgi:hypothetical protein